MNDSRSRTAVTRSCPARCLVVSLVAATCTIGESSAQAPPPPNVETLPPSKLAEIFAADAAEFTVFRDIERQERLELVKKPVYSWQNHVRSNGQYGAVFVWTFRGCPELVGSIFSNPLDAKRAVLHEFHSLSTQRLSCERTGATTWVTGATLAREPMSDAPQPAASPKARSRQLRTLARGFSAHSISPYDDQRWELRLLPQPLYRYESIDPNVIDGALFAFVTSAGTDPEILLLIESRATASDPKWHYAAARFSDFNLFLDYRGKNVWQALRDAENSWDHNANHTYRIYRDRIIDTPAPAHERP